METILVVMRLPVNQRLFAHFVSPFFMCAHLFAVDIKPVLSAKKGVYLTWSSFCTIHVDRMNTIKKRNWSVTTVLMII